MLPQFNQFYHIARKATPVVDKAGKTVTPAVPNSIKLESFIFDVFLLAASSVVFECTRANHFAPVKNAAGAASDTAATARAMLLARCRKWLQKAGAKLSGEGCVEVLPGLSYGGEDLEDFKGLPIALDRGCGVVLRSSKGLKKAKEKEKAKPTLATDYLPNLVGLSLQCPRKGDEYYKAKVLEVGVKVHYLGYGADEDAWVPLDKVQSKLLK